jgi:O-antigen/teichoic acid export membrane protein
MRVLRAVAGSVSESTGGALGVAVRRVAQDARVWVVIATVAAQVSAFLVSVLITRTQGIAALGLYSATLNVAALFSKPFISMLEYNGAMLSADQPTLRGALLRAHAPALFVLIAIGLAGFVLLAPASGLPNVWNGTYWWLWLAAVSVMFNHLQSSIAQGLLQGVGVFVRPAQWRLGWTICTTTIAVPIIGWAGLHGAYMLLALNSITMPLIATWIYLHPEKPAPARAIRRSEMVSVRVVTRAHLKSVPNVGTALSESCITWFCLVFLVNKSHGTDGLGWVSLGLQWTTLMLLPATSWGGVTLKRLIDAKNSGSASTVRRTMYNQMLQNAAITLMVAGGVLLGSPILAAIYKVQWSILWPILAACGFYAVLAAAINVFERLFFCMERQGTWMAVTLLSGVVQCAITYLTVATTVLGVFFGLCAGTLTLFLASWFYRERALTAVATA